VNTKSATAVLRIRINIVPVVLPIAPKSNLVDGAVTYNLDANQRNIEMSTQTQPLMPSVLSEGAPKSGVVVTTTVVLK
jgi:hypothetical protein